jgi:hypothetical protein
MGKIMPSLEELTDAKGRIAHDKLRDFVSGVSLSEFTEMAKHPFLVGKELYDGEISKKAGNQNNPSGTSTMMFNVAALRNHIDEKQIADKYKKSPMDTDEKNYGGITHAVYMLRKRKFSSSDEQNTIKIGRAMDNDIVIADFVVSKNHAQIVIFHDMYFVLDMKSTNGTKVNERPVAPGMKVQLQTNSTLAFGRYCFVFAHPLQVYRGMRKEMLGI